MKEYSKTRFWQTQILSRNPQSWEIPHCVWKNVQKLIFGQTKNPISHDQTNLSVKNLNMSYQKSSEFGNFHNIYEWMFKNSFWANTKVTIDKSTEIGNSTICIKKCSKTRSLANTKS